MKNREFDCHSFGNNLKMALNFRALKQKDLAKRIGTTEASISRYINGQRIPTTEMLCKISNALNINLDDLVWGPSYNSKELFDDEIKLNERGFEILCLLAFRYAINRHGTQCMTRGAGNGDTIESIVLDNLEHINANFKCQMMEDITRELRIYDDLEADEEGRWGWCKRMKTESGYFITYENPHYLERMLNALKEDYKATHNGEEWHDGVQL